MRRLTFAQLTRDGFGNAAAAAAPTAPRLVIYLLATAALGWVSSGSDSSLTGMLLYGLALVVVLFTGCHWSASIYRHLIPQAGAGRHAADTWRLVLANCAVYLFFFILLFILGLFLTITAGILIAVSGFDPVQVDNDPTAIMESLRLLSLTGGAVTLYVIIAVLALAVLWVGLRLFLFGAATIAERKVTIFSSWAWTKGQVVPLAGAWICWQGITLVLLSMAADGVLAAFHLPTVYLGQFLLPESTVVAEWEWAASEVIATLFTAPVILIGHAMAASAYTRLAPNVVDPDATFG